MRPEDLKDILLLLNDNKETVALERIRFLMANAAAQRKVISEETRKQIYGYLFTIASKTADLCFSAMRMMAHLGTNGPTIAVFDIPSARVAQRVQEHIMILRSQNTSRNLDDHLSSFINRLTAVIAEKARMTDDPVPSAQIFLAGQNANANVGSAPNPIVASMAMPNKNYTFRRNAGLGRTYDEIIDVIESDPAYAQVLMHSVIPDTDKDIAALVPNYKQELEDFLIKSAGLPHLFSDAILGLSRLSFFKTATLKQIDNIYAVIIQQKVYSSATILFIQELNAYMGTHHQTNNNDDDDEKNSKNYEREMAQLGNLLAQQELNVDEVRTLLAYCKEALTHDGNSSFAIHFLKNIPQMHVRAAHEMLQEGSHLLFHPEILLQLDSHGKTNFSPLGRFIVNHYAGDLDKFQLMSNILKQKTDVKHLNDELISAYFEAKHPSGKKRNYDTALGNPPSHTQKPALPDWVGTIYFASALQEHLVSSKSGYVLGNKTPSFLTALAQMLNNKNRSEEFDPQSLKISLLNNQDFGKEYRAAAQQICNGLGINIHIIENNDTRLVHHLIQPGVSSAQTWSNVAYNDLNTLHLAVDTSGFIPLLLSSATVNNTVNHNNNGTNSNNRFF